MKKLISNSAYELLTYSGHVVPRTESNDVQTNFSVGKEYYVTSKDNLEPIKVRCTQDCPHHLKAMHSFIGVSEGKEYPLYAVRLETMNGLCDIEGYNSPQWCLFEEIKKVD